MPPLVKQPKCSNKQCFRLEYKKCITFLATIDKLSSVDAFSSNEQLCPLLEAVWITESHFSQRCTTSRVVDNILVVTKGTMLTMSQDQVLSQT